MGTRLQNNLDKKAKGRCYRPTGEKHHLAKLTEQQVFEIIHRYKNENITQQQLANEYNIAGSGISRIIRGIEWSYLRLNSPSQTDTPH